MSTYFLFAAALCLPCSDANLFILFWQVHWDYTDTFSFFLWFFGVNSSYHWWLCLFPPFWFHRFLQAFLISHYLLFHCSWNQSNFLYSRSFLLTILFSVFLHCGPVSHKSLPSSVMLSPCSANFCKSFLRVFSLFFIASSWHCMCKLTSGYIWAHILCH